MSLPINVTAANALATLRYDLDGTLVVDGHHIDLIRIQSRRRQAGESDYTANTRVTLTDRGVAPGRLFTEIEVEFAPITPENQHSPVADRIMNPERLSVEAKQVAVAMLERATSPTTAPVGGSLLGRFDTTGLVPIDLYDIRTGDTIIIAADDDDYGPEQVTRFTAESVHRTNWDYDRDCEGVVISRGFVGSNGRAFAEERLTSWNLGSGRLYLEHRPG